VRTVSIVIASTLVVTLMAASQGERSGGIAAGRIAKPRPLESTAAAAGPYKVEFGPAFGSPDHVVYRPANLTAFPARDMLPVMAWGNGGCAINSIRYAGFLTTVASHGFVVLATAAPPGRRGGDATADHLRQAIDWAEAENRRRGSPLIGKIALDRVAVVGQSCGGFLALELGADPRVDTIAMFNSGAQGDDVARIPALHGPVLLINGHEEDFARLPSRTTFDAIQKQPVFYGARHRGGHMGTIDHPGGGEFATVASNWLRWQLKRDRHAAKMFVGKDCSLCTNPNWDTASKRLR
jgi:poly(3-hydroxybutyrate) depolymerase